MKTTIRRQIFDNQVVVCPHCGSDHDPLRIPKFTRTDHICAQCSKKIDSPVFVPVGSPRDPQFWRGEEALRLIRQVRPEVIAVDVDRIRGIWWPARDGAGEIGVLVPPTPEQESEGLGQGFDVVYVTEADGEAEILTSR